MQEILTKSNLVTTTLWLRAQSRGARLMIMIHVHLVWFSVTRLEDPYPVNILLCVNEEAIASDSFLHVLKWLVNRSGTVLSSLITRLSSCLIYVGHPVERQFPCLTRLGGNMQHPCTVFQIHQISNEYLLPQSHHIPQVLSGVHLKPQRNNPASHISSSLKDLQESAPEPTELQSGSLKKTIVGCSI